MCSAADCKVLALCFRDFELCFLYSYFTMPKHASPKQEANSRKILFICVVRETNSCNDVEEYQYLL